MDFIFKSISYSVLVLLSFLSLSSSAQDVHFSQRLAHNRQRNASFIGDFEGSYQAYTIYRQQWQAIAIPFNTSAIAVSKRIKTSNKALTFIGGLAFQNDQSGDAKLAITQPSINLGVDYLWNGNTFAFGMATKLVNKAFDQNGLTFPSQYDRSLGQFNDQLNNNEGVLANNLSYLDFDLGLRWARQLNEKWKVNTGVSTMHLTEPEETFFSGDNRKRRGYGAQLNATYTMNKKLTVNPYIAYYNTASASETIIGSELEINILGEALFNKIIPFMFVRTGPSRTTDAVIVGSRVQIKNFDLGASYDFNISDLELASNYQGGLELSLIYSAAFKKLDKIRIPCVRY